MPNKEKTKPTSQKQHQKATRTATPTGSYRESKLVATDPKREQLRLTALSPHQHQLQHQHPHRTPNRESDSVVKATSEVHDQTHCHRGDEGLTAHHDVLEDMANSQRAQQWPIVVAAKCLIEGYGQQLAPPTGGEQKGPQRGPRRQRPKETTRRSSVGCLLYASRHRIRFNQINSKRSPHPHVSFELMQPARLLIHTFGSMMAFGCSSQMLVPLHANKVAHTAEACGTHKFLPLQKALLVSTVSTPSASFPM